jgi:type IX secretion system PorP/SprF family membrane protein
MNMRITLFLFFIILTQWVRTQELPVYNEYHLNKSLINPAIIGSEECTWFKCTDRHQWLGIQGAPRIQTLSVDASISNKKAIRETDKRVHGIGGYLFRDKNGAYRDVGGQLSYAYHFYLSKLYGIKVGMGLSFQLIQSSLNESGFRGDFDPVVTGGISSTLVPNAGAGIFMYSKNFYAGLSAANLLPFSSELSGGLSSGKRNYFLIAGFLSGNSKSRIRILPSVVIKTTEDLRKQIDINEKLLLNDSWWLGLSFRHNFDQLPGSPVSIIPMTGLTRGSFTFVYALDITPGSIQRFNYGTHEFMISYQLCRDGFRCPVYR